MNTENFKKVCIKNKFGRMERLIKKEALILMQNNPDSNWRFIDKKTYKEYLSNLTANTSRRITRRKVLNLQIFKHINKQTNQIL